MGARGLSALLAGAALASAALAAAACGSSSDAVSARHSPATSTTDTAPAAGPSSGPAEPELAPPGKTSSSALIASLVPTEKAIVNRATRLSELPRLGASEQLDVAALADHPEWMPSVLAAAPPDARQRIRANVEADTQLAAISSSKGTTFPPWQILRPQPAAALLHDYHAAQSATGVPWYVLAAIHLVETRTGRIRGPSSAGALGPMQFIPGTWARFGDGGDIWSDHDSIQAAARLLAYYGAPAHLEESIYHYNDSAHYVQAVLSYASVMAADERAYYAYYGWQVYVSTTSGTYLLPPGFRGPGSS